jgi:hypothetical protein
MASTPTDPTKAQVWITGTAPNQQFEFYIPRGAKGETGGITFGADLNGLDLNAVRTAGVYRLSATQSALLLKNYPRDTDTGVLVVHNRTADTNTTDQEWITFSGTNGTAGRYIRQYNNGTWSAWRYMPSHRVDQTAGRAIYEWDDLNQRDQLVYGDTGWRNVTALGATSAGNVYLRRYGSTVTLQWNAWAASAGSSIGDMPTGFRPFAPVYLPIIHPVSRGVRAWLLNTNGSNAIVNAAVDEVFNTSATWQTTEAWPTTLPGTAFGALPIT